MSDFLIYTIDDDVDFNVVLSMTLKSHGIRVKTHTNPHDFTASVKEQMPNLCILDLNLDLPGEGFQLLRAMRNVLGSELPIFVMSKRGSREDVFKVMESGANDFIPKPLDDKYLLLKLKEYIVNNKEIQDMDHLYSKIADTDRDGVINMKFRTVKVGIDIFEVEGEVFLTKNMNLTFDGPVLKDIFSEDQMSFKVVDSWQITDTVFGAKLEKELNSEQLFALRRWLVHKDGEVN